MSAVRNDAKVGTDLASRTAEAKAPDKSAKTMTDAARVGHEFEAIFVRTMLRSTPLGSRSDAYTDMGVDALAKSVTAGRGLGLADRIREALEASEKAHGRAAPAEKTSEPLKKP